MKKRGGVKKALRLKCFKMEAPPRFELGVKILQTSALPLGYGAASLEWETGFGPATFTLAR